MNKHTVSNQASYWSRIFPHPFLSLILALSWLMLMHSVHIAQLLIALLAAIAIPKLTQLFIQPGNPVNWGAVIKLFFVVCWDIVVANIRVAKLVLGRVDQLQPAWIRIPLETTHPQVNTFLALIITTTPGTVSVGLDDEQNNILVHALNTTDTNAVITEIKTRYEQPLMTIFGVQAKEQPHDR